MFVAHDFRTASRSRDSALVIGNFDGLHRGHRALLRHALELAAEKSLDTVVLTFEPHPARILAPERAPALLTGLDRRLELLQETGVACTIVQLFDRRLGALEPEAFAQEVLLALRARCVVVGEDFRFGKDRAGDGAALRKLGSQLGFEVHLLPKVQEAGDAISSTRVRKSLQAGDLDLATRLLGRNFDFDGVVIHGQHRGRTLGFPTANLATPVEALPKDGVYAVRVSCLGDAPKQGLPGVMNLGVRPTFGAGRSVEVHILEGEHQLYGMTLRIECVARLRDEQKFSGLEALQRQIQVDSQQARSLLEAQHS